MPQSHRYQPWMTCRSSSAKIQPHLWRERTFCLNIGHSYPLLVYWGASSTCLSSISSSVTGRPWLPLSTRWSGSYEGREPSHESLTISPQDGHPVSSAVFLCSDSLAILPHVFPTVSPPRLAFTWDGEGEEWRGWNGRNNLIRPSWARLLLCSSMFCSK